MPLLGEGEPYGTREAALVKALRAHLAPDSAACVPLCSTVRDPTGYQIHDLFVTRLELSYALDDLRAADPLGAQVIEAYEGGQAWTLRETAKRLHRDTQTVVHAHLAALTWLIRCRWLWNEPDYEPPLRVRPRHGLQLDPIEENFRRLRRAGMLR